MINILKRILGKFKKNTKKGNDNLCSMCKTGMYFLKLDKNEPHCPYMECHTGSKCSAYVGGGQRPHA